MQNKANWLIILTSLVNKINYLMLLTYKLAGEALALFANEIFGGSLSQYIS